MKLSNTLTLEQDFGWMGVCIEPNPQYELGFYPRKCQLVKAAVGNKDNEEVTFNFKGALGGIVGEDFDNQKREKSKTMLTVSVAKAFKDLGVPKEIDYLSLDIEVGQAITYDWVVLHRPPPRMAPLTKYADTPSMVLHAVCLSVPMSFLSGCRMVGNEDLPLG